MTSTPNRRTALAMITAARPAAPAPERRPRPTSPAHQALEARLVGCFG